MNFSDKNIHAFMANDNTVILDQKINDQLIVHENKRAQYLEIFVVLKRSSAIITHKNLIHFLSKLDFFQNVQHVDTIEYIVF